MASKIIVSENQWNEMYLQLRLRGNDERESGAFLLASPGSDDITDIQYFDDLDPDCLADGYVEFKARGFIRLWDYCMLKKLHVVADVHTHPSDFTSQSSIDRVNPMISTRGHLALIIPSYAQDEPSLHGVGAFEYKGNFQWRRLQVSELISLTKSV